MHRDLAEATGRGVPDPIGPEEVEPVGEGLAQAYEDARIAYGCSGREVHRFVWLAYRLALRNHIKEYGEAVETARRIYRIGPHGTLVDHPITLDLCAARERRQIEASHLSGA